jgi:AcrR family transcriptional regulator
VLGGMPRRSTAELHNRAMNGPRAGERTPRQRMVYQAVQLIRAKGVSGTGLREVVARAQAPRGSLQHYFPGGKEQLVGEALGWAGDFAAAEVDRVAQTLPRRTPSALFEAMAGWWRQELDRTGFSRGCPIVATVADAAANDNIRQAARQAAAHWQEPIAAALADMGVPARRAPALALLMLSTLEGAIVFARVRGDNGPLDTAVAELGPMLDSAVTAGR